MGEVKTPLVKMSDLTFRRVNDLDLEQCYIISDTNSHCDILRFIIDDIGYEEALYLLKDNKPKKNLTDG